jgi:hypothetical protein
MTRKERQDAARKRRQHQIEEWVEELREHMAGGKTYKQACEIMAAETARAIDKNPQQKHEIVAAWKELFARIHKSAGEVSSANATADQTNDSEFGRADGCNNSKKGEE